MLATHPTHVSMFITVRQSVGFEFPKLFTALIWSAKTIALQSCCAGGYLCYLKYGHAHSRTQIKADLKQDIYRGERENSEN